MDMAMIVDGAWTIGQGLLMVVGGAAIILKYIAPRTKTLVDDRIYAYVEKVLKFLSQAEDNVAKVRISVSKK